MAMEPWGCMEPIDTSTIQVAELLTDADIEKAKTRLEEIEAYALAHGGVLDTVDNSSIIGKELKRLTREAIQWIEKEAIERIEEGAIPRLTIEAIPLGKSENTKIKCTWSV